MEKKLRRRITGLKRRSWIKINDGVCSADEGWGLEKRANDLNVTKIVSQIISPQI